MDQEEFERKQTPVKKRGLIIAAIVAVTVIGILLTAVIAALHDVPDNPAGNTESSSPPDPAPETTVITVPTEATQGESSPDVSQEPTENTEPPSWDELYNFRETNEQVTAKEETNLRDIPSQDEDSTVLYTLKNGEIAVRIAISDYGWSKLEFNGQIYYALSSLLTTDLTPPPYQIQTQFTDVYESVTAKEVVNLRSLPSVTHEESVVIAQLVHGEIAVRTGINEDVGWSRIEYNGQTLYCISSYLMPAEEISDPTE